MSGPFEVIPEGQAEFQAPIPRPPSIRDFMALEEHIVNSSRAFGHEVNPVYYEIPVFYLTNPAAVRGPNDGIPMAPGTERCDYELEFAAVMGDACGDLDPATLLPHVNTSGKPGDIIGSGTVGTGCILELSRVHSEAEYPWLEPGDSVRLEVEHVGAVESNVVAGQTVVPL